MDFAIYMLIGTVGTAIYGICLCGGLAVLKRREPAGVVPVDRA